VYPRRLQAAEDRMRAGQRCDVPCSLMSFENRLAIFVCPRTIESGTRFLAMQVDQGWRTQNLGGDSRQTYLAEAAR